MREAKGKKPIPTLTFHEWGRLSRILVPEWIVFPDDGIWEITRSPLIHLRDQRVPQQHRKRSGSRTNGEADEAIRTMRVWLSVGSTGMAPFSHSTTHPRPLILFCVTFLAGNGHPIPPIPSGLRYGITQHSLTLTSPWLFIVGITSLIGLP